MIRFERGTIMHYNDEFANDKLENIENSNFEKNEKNDNNCDCAFSTTKQIVMLIINAILIILYFVFNIWEMAVQSAYEGRAF